MSLGGYKFAGRYCQKGSLTDQQWAKRMQETKVAAFMAANALANAGWEYDMDGSPDGNIHCLDTVGNNYVTCFKNTALGHYFCILTLTMFRPQTETEGYVITTRLYRCSITSTYYIGRQASAFVRYSTLHRFDYSSVLSDWYTGQSLLVPVGNPGHSQTPWSGSVTNDNTKSLFNINTNYYGFALKGADIIIFSGPSASGCAVSVVSGNAFSKLFSPEESYGANKGELILNLQNTYTGTTANANESSPQYTGSGGLVICSNGTSQNVMDDLSSLYVPPIAMFSGNIQDYPFQSVYVVAYKQNPTTLIYGVGTIKIELLAANFMPSAQYPNHLTPVANGNFLAATSFSNGIPSGANQLCVTSGSVEGVSVSIPITYYVGWDASNPDITQSSAWTLYE